MLAIILLHEWLECGEVDVAGEHECEVGGVGKHRANNVYSGLAVGLFDDVGRDSLTCGSGEEGLLQQLDECKLGSVLLVGDKAFVHTLGTGKVVFGDVVFGECGEDEFHQGGEVLYGRRAFNVARVVGELYAHTYLLALEVLVDVAVVVRAEAVFAHGVGE